MPRALVWIRRIVCLATALALGVLAVFKWSPHQADALGRWWRARVETHYLARLEAIGELSRRDPAAAHASLLGLAEELRDVRKEDRLATLVRIVQRRLVDHAMAVSDLDGAVDAARRWFELDDRDIDAVGRLGAALAAREATRAEGIELLRDYAGQVEGHPALVVPLCNALVAEGQHAAAAASMLAAAEAPTGGVWSVQWSSDPRMRGWVMARRFGAGEIELRFTIDQTIDGLRLAPPPGSAFALRDATLALEHGEPTRTRHLEVPSHSVAAPIAFPELRCAARPTTVTLLARAEPRAPDWLRELARSPAGRAAAAADPRVLELGDETR